jgi:hypothetical protein
MFVEKLSKAWKSLSIYITRLSWCHLFFCRWQERYYFCRCEGESKNYLETRTILCASGGRSRRHIIKSTYSWVHLSQALRFKDNNKFFVTHSLNAAQATITTSVIATFRKTAYVLPTSSSSSSVVVVIKNFSWKNSCCLPFKFLSPLPDQNKYTNYVVDSLGQEVYNMLERDF